MHCKSLEPGIIFCVLCDLFGARRSNLEMRMHAFEHKILICNKLLVKHKHTKNVVCPSPVHCSKTFTKACHPRVVWLVKKIFLLTCK